MRLVSALPALLLLAGSLALPLAAAEDGPGKPDRGQERGPDRGMDRMLQRLIADNPELKGVDPATPEGQEKIRAAMGAQMRKRMSERQAANHAALKTSFAMADAEFTAIEPLLSKVENLRQQKMLADPPGAMFRGGPGGPGGGPGGDNGRGRGMFNPQNMLNPAELDPSVKEVQDATKALKTLVDDPQANAAELTATVNRVRKAREAYQATLTKAQEDLRGVLTPRQEAILIEQGALE